MKRFTAWMSIVIPSIAITAYAPPVISTMYWLIVSALVIKWSIGWLWRTIARDL